MTFNAYILIIIFDMKHKILSITLYKWSVSQ